MVRFCALLLVLAPSVFASIRGTVYSANGTPVAGARIAAFRPASILDERVRIAAGIAREPLAVATSKDDGTFAVETKRGGMIELLVERDGFAPDAQFVLDGESDVVIDLKRAATRTGRITANGKPVPNVIVVAEERQRPMWTTKSDANGAFQIAGPETWTSALRFVHPDYAMHTAQTVLDVALTPGVSIKGKVFRSAAAKPPPSRARIFLDGWPVATSTDDGTFTIAHAPAAANTIVAILGDEHGSAKRADHVDIELASGKSITGSVRDASKKPLAGALVAAYTLDNDLFTAVADDAGNYRIAPLAAAEYGVIVQPAGELEFEMGSAKLQRGNETARVDFTATAKTFLRGTVVDGAGKPVAGAYALPLMAEASLPLFYGRMQHPDAEASRSGTDGRFKMKLPAEFKGRVQVVHPKYAMAFADIESVAKPLKITLHEGIEVRGLVVDGNDKPVAGASIGAIQDPTGMIPMPIHDALAHEEYFIALVQTDADGKFVAHFNDAVHDVGAWKQGFSGTTVSNVKPERGMQPVKLVLARGVEIRGRVAGKSPGANLLGGITAVNESGSQRTASTKEDGTFVIDSLVPGVYQLNFISSEGRTAETSVTAPASDVVLELAQRAEIRGRVVDAATRTPIRSFSISVSGEGTSFNAASYEDADTFIIAADVGIVEVTANANGYSAQTLNAVVALDKIPELSFALTRARTITGRVTGETGEPVEEASVSLTTAGQNIDDGSYVQTDAEGMYDLENITREAAEINVRATGYMSRKIAVRAGGDERLDVRLARGRKASGRVVSANGAPVEGAEVTAISRSVDMDYQNATTNAQGVFEVQGLAPGLIMFTASHQDHGRVTVRDVDIDKTPVVIAFEAHGPTGTIHGTVLGYTEQQWMTAAVHAINPDTGRNVSAQVARDGTYRLERVPAGGLEVRLQVANMRTQAYTALQHVELAAGADLELNLRAGSDITLRGTVSEGGVPLPAGTTINFIGPGNWSTRAGSNGTYELTGIEPGPYEVHVTSMRRNFETRYTVSGSATYDIAIAYAHIEGRVIANGEPVAGAEVELTPQGAPYGDTVTTDANGTFRFSVGESPSFVLSASKKGYANAVRRIDRAGDPIVLELVRADGVRVKLIDARDGKPLDGYAVATHPSGLLAGSVNELQDGHLSLPLLPGPYRVSVSAGGYASQSRHVTVPHEGELRFLLTEGGTLIVNAERGAGELVKLVMPNGEEYVRCQCNRIAEIRLTGPVTKIDHVAPGSYTMHVYDEQGRIKSSQPVTIAEGQTTTAAVHVPE